MPQLTIENQRLIDDVCRRNRRSGADALRGVNLQREKRHLEPVEKKAVYQYIRGATHVRGATETRGRKAILTRRDVVLLQQARRRLIKRADGDHRVTYQMIMDEAALPSSPGLRTVEDALRDDGVGYRKPREKVYLTDKDAKRRLRFAE